MENKKWENLGLLEGVDTELKPNVSGALNIASDFLKLNNKDCDIKTQSALFALIVKIFREGFIKSNKIHNYICDIVPDFCDKHKLEKFNSQEEEGEFVFNYYVNFLKLEKSLTKEDLKEYLKKRIESSELNKFSTEFKNSFSVVEDIERNLPYIGISEEDDGKKVIYSSHFQFDLTDDEFELYKKLIVEKTEKLLNKFKKEKQFLILDYIKQ